MVTSKKAADDSLLRLEVENLEADARIAESKLHIALGDTIRSIGLIGEVNAEVAIQHVNNLGKWHEIDKHNGTMRDIFFTMNSFGGSTVDAFCLYDYFTLLRRAGHRLTIQVDGVAAMHSVALLQNADLRVISPHSQIMLTQEDLRAFHANSANSEEKIQFLRDLEKQGWQRIAERSDLSVEEIESRTNYGRQWWFTAEEALERGLVDKIGVEGPEIGEFGNYDRILDVSAPLKDRKRNAIARKLKAETALANLASENILAGDANQLLFFFPVDWRSVHIARRALEAFSRKPGSDVTIYINSPGGSVIDGLALMDSIHALRERGHKVTTVAMGMAASMGGFLLQAGDRRVITANSRILIHRISRIFAGTGAEVADQKEMMQKLESRAMPLLCGRSKLTVQEVYDRSKNRDWWLTAQEALELGFVDEIW